MPSNPGHLFRSLRPASSEPVGSPGRASCRWALRAGTQLRRWVVAAGPVPCPGCPEPLARGYRITEPRGLWGLVPQGFPGPLLLLG